ENTGVRPSAPRSSREITSERILAMTPVLIAIFAFVGVAALIGTLAFVFTDNSNSRVTDRLDTLTGKKVKDDPNASILRKQAFEGDKKSLLEMLTPNFPSMDKYFRQADCHIPASTLVGISGLLAAVGGTLSWLLTGNLWLAPIVGLVFFTVPWIWL